VASGENVKVVAELLGHASPTITQNIYQHVLPGRSDAAGERLSVALLAERGGIIGGRGRVCRPTIASGVILAVRRWRERS
jgi:hypothetical protein